MISHVFLGGYTVFAEPALNSLFRNSCCDLHVFRLEMAGKLVCKLLMFEGIFCCAGDANSLLCYEV